MRARVDEPLRDDDLVTRLAAHARTAQAPSVPPRRRRALVPAAVLAALTLTGGIGVSYAAGIVEAPWPILPSPDPARPTPTSSPTPAPSASHTPAPTPSTAAPSPDPTTKPTPDRKSAQPGQGKPKGDDKRPDQSGQSNGNGNGKAKGHDPTAEPPGQGNGGGQGKGKAKATGHDKPKLKPDKAKPNKPKKPEKPGKPAQDQGSVTPSGPDDMKPVKSQGPRVPR